LRSRLAELTEKVHQIRVLYADLLGIVSEMDREHDASTAGYSSLAGMIVDATRLAPRIATRMVKNAAQITETLTPTGHTTPAPLPTARAAMREGVLDGEHLEVIAEVVKDLPQTASVADRELVEATMTTQARALDPLALRRFGKQVLEQIDQDGKQPDDKDVAEPTNSMRYRRTRGGRM